jgi:hypothetical protein
VLYIPESFSSQDPFEGLPHGTFKVLYADPACFVYLVAHLSLSLVLRGCRRFKQRLGSLAAVVDPPKETIIYVLRVMARTIAYDIDGPKRGAELMHEMLRLCLPEDGDTPADYDKRH